MKKRTIVAIILTIFMLFVAKDFWCVDKPIKFSYNLKGDGNYQVRTILNPVFNDIWEGKRSVSKDIKLSGNSNITAFFNVKKCKKLKISFSQNLLSIDPLYITDMKFNDGKYCIKDFEIFVAEGADLKIENNSLVIIPKNKDFSLVYNSKLNVKSFLSFEFEIFIIILVLSFLLFNKLLNYVADFSTVRHKSRIEIIFLILFFTILFLPMIHINQDEKSDHENRYLATWQPVIKDGKINLAFGKDFESWYNDRFNLREYFIDISHSLKKVNKIYSFNGYSYDKQYNLLYTGSFNGLKEPKAKELKKQSYLEKLTRFQSYCNKRNIKLYVLVVPRGAEFFEYTIIDKQRGKKDFAIELIQFLSDNSELKIIFPREQMLEANKQTPMYFATDHHWTKKAAYLGYYELMKVIQKDFSNVWILEESELEKYYDKRVSATSDNILNRGQTFEHLRLAKKYEKKLLVRDYIYYKNPYAKNLKNEKIKGTFDERFYYPNSNGLKTLIIGNSFAKNLVEFLPYSFNKTIRYYDNYRNFNMEEYEKIIEDYKPNIIILNFQTSYFPRLLNMYESQIKEEE